MKFLETPEEKKSFTITSVIFVILFLLFTIFGLTYMDPPPENGIAVNFGTSDMGSGEIQPTAPVQMSPEQAQSEPVPAEEDDVLTQDDEAPVTLPKSEVKKPVTKPVESKTVKPADKKPDKATTDILNSFNNGPKQDGTKQEGHGDNAEGGDKGNLNGSLYANSFYGDGSGIGTGSGSYGLKGRGKSISSKKFIQECGKKNIYGKVIVRIEVDKSGKVVKAEAGVKGTEDTSACLLEAAKKTAFSYKWKPDDNAPDRQIGFIEINFTPQLPIENDKK